MHPGAAAALPTQTLRVARPPRLSPVTTSVTTQTLPVARPPRLSPPHLSEPGSIPCSTPLRLPQLLGRHVALIHLEGRAGHRAARKRPRGQGFRRDLRGPMKLGLRPYSEYVFI